MHMKLLDPEYLAKGSARQVEAYRALKNLDLFERLKEHSPVLAGTIPLDLDIDGSDLAIICSAENLEDFAEKLQRAFGSEADFKVSHTVVRERPTVVAKFRAHGFPVEVFAQSESVFTQPAVLSMLVEARLLAFSPGEAKQRILALMKSGTKTEPAFAEVFFIEGDPYEELLKIATLADREILMIAHRFHFLS
jgi:hypothetical protein